MTQTIINIKRRMKSVGNIRKITRAMEMVSMSKLNRVRTMLFASRHYFARLESVMNDFLSAAGNVKHPLLEKRAGNLKTGICVITSDTGLCRTYNQAVIRACEEFIAEFKKEDIMLLAVGKEGYHHFKRAGFRISGSYLELHGKYIGRSAQAITDDLTNLFLKEDLGEAYVAYTHFETTLRHKPKVEKFLNIETTGDHLTNYLITEPDPDTLAQEIVPKYLSEKFRLFLLEAFTSEHAARMFAMKTATDNADELMDVLTLYRNKARQAAITKEVIEIASAAEAMRN